MIGLESYQAICRESGYQRMQEQYSAEQEYIDFCAERDELLAKVCDDDATIEAFKEKYASAYDDEYFEVSDNEIVELFKGFVAERGLTNFITD